LLSLLVSASEGGRNAGSQLASPGSWHNADDCLHDEDELNTAIELHLEDMLKWA
jgi:hypothetical protein